MQFIVSIFSLTSFADSYNVDKCIGVICCDSGQVAALVSVGFEVRVIPLKGRLQQLRHGRQEGEGKGHFHPHRSSHGAVTYCNVFYT